ncbi:hypothetical protein L4D09_02335 [Photobacterium makurazakiensis]|uniref:hypothetical protein n=1 Tax=Photobacterium makurazakiensis TaxID=2910234 RepID=UPI003D0B2393
MKHQSSIFTLSLLASSLSIHDATANEYTPAQAQAQQEIDNLHWSGLPVFGEQARALGYDLPIPVGFGIYMNTQEVEYIAENDFGILAKGGTLGRLCGFGGSSSSSRIPSKPSKPQPGSGECAMSIPAENVSITGKDESIQLRLDAWIFPFMNVYGLAGYTRGSKNILADLSNVTINGRQTNGINATLPLNLEYEAYNLGLGTVLATQFTPINGMRPIIVTAVGAMTNSWTTTTDSTIKTYIGALRVGQRYDLPHGKLTLMGGYTYQMIQQNVSGTIDLAGTELDNLADTIDFDVDLKSKESNNMAVTAVYDFGDNNEWMIFAEYGFLNWNQLTFSVGRRF